MRLQTHDRRIDDRLLTLVRLWADPRPGPLAAGQRGPPGRLGPGLMQWNQLDRGVRGLLVLGRHKPGIDDALPEQLGEVLGALETGASNQPCLGYGPGVCCRVGGCRFQPQLALSPEARSLMHRALELDQRSVSADAPFPVLLADLDAECSGTLPLVTHVV